MKTAIKIIQSKNVEELNGLISVFEEVFVMKDLKRPGKSHLLNLLDKDTFFIVVAKQGKEVIGGLTLYILDQYYSEKPLAYIYDLAVLTEFQRKGIGKKLMEFTREYCTRKGFEEIFVQADQVGDYAIDFYRLIRPTNELHVVQFSYTLA